MPGTAPASRYRDFSIQAHRSADGRFTVEVIDSPAGSAQGRLNHTLDFRRVREAFAELAGSVGSGAQRHVKSGGTRANTQRSTPSSLGNELFEALFPRPVRSCFDESLGIVRQGGAAGLRLKLHQPPEDDDARLFASLPWELLYRAHQHRFLGLDRRTPVVRHLAVPHPSDSLPPPYPLRIAVVPSAPRDSPRLALEAELRAIEAAWKGIDGIDAFAVEPSILGLREAIIDRRCHVLHYMGHGAVTSAGRGGLVLEAPGGGSRIADAAALQTVFQGSDQLRLVVLNACSTAWAPSEPGSAPFGGVAHALVLGGVPAVVAMSLPVSDHAAIEFSAGLFRYLARGEPVDVATCEGRSLVYALDSGSTAWATPAVLCQVPDVALFEARSSAEVEGEPRRLFDRGLARFQDGRFGSAREDFCRATELAEEYFEADLYACLATLSSCPPASLGRDEAHELNSRLGRLADVAGDRVRSCALVSLGLLRYDFFRQKNLKVEGLQTDEVVRLARALPPNPRVEEACAGIRCTLAARLAVGLRPRSRQP